MKRIIMFIILSGLLFAQDKKSVDFGWKNQITSDLNFTQNSFDNWSAGGEDIWSWALNVNAKFENDQEKYNWATSGKFQFGRAQIGNGPAQKAADEINLETVYTYKLGSTINPYGSFKLLSQVANGFNYGAKPAVQISAAFDPLYLTESIGMGYAASKFLKTRLGAAVKQTFSKSEYGFADDPSTTNKIESSRNELGAESVTELSIPLSEKIIYDGKIELFSDLRAVNTVDVNWDNTFSAQVSDIIKVSFNFKLFYDRDISRTRQLKQTLAVGLSYTFL